MWSTRGRCLHTRPTDVEWEVRVPPLQGHDRVSSLFMYSCKAFRRASISAMSAPWKSELYSVKAEVVCWGRQTRRGLKQPGAHGLPLLSPQRVLG